MHDGNWRRRKEARAIFVKNSEGSESKTEESFSIHPA